MRAVVLLPCRTRGRGDRNPTIVADGVERVQQQIEESLLELMGISVKDIARSRVVPFQADFTGAQLRLNEANGPFEDFVQRHPGQMWLWIARATEHFGNDRIDS